MPHIHGLRTPLVLERSNNAPGGWILQSLDMYQIAGMNSWPHLASFCMCYDSSMQRLTSVLCGHGCCNSIPSAGVQLQRKCSDIMLLLKLIGNWLSGCGSSS